MNNSKIKSSSKHVKALALIGAAANLNCAFADGSANSTLESLIVDYINKASADQGTTNPYSSIVAVENADASTFSIKTDNGEILYFALKDAAGNLIKSTNNYAPRPDGSRLDENFVGNTGNKNGYNGINGGAIYHFDSKNHLLITSDFIGNLAIHGGAIMNYSKILSLSGDFIGNSATKIGGAIYNGIYSSTVGTFDSITGNFIGNYAGDKGGAIYNIGNFESITGDFIGNSAGNQGGAIYNSGGSITLKTDASQNMQITGNSVGTGDAQSFEAIYNLGSSSKNASVKFDAAKNRSIIVNDAINGSSEFVENQKLTISGAGKTEFNNTVSNQKISVESGTLKLGSYAGATDLGTKNAIAKLINSDVTVYENATLVIGADKTGDESIHNVVFEDNSFTLNGALEMEQNAALEFVGDTEIAFSDSANVLIDLGELSPSLENPYTAFVFDDAETANAFLTELREMRDNDTFNMTDENGNYLADNLWDVTLNGMSIDVIPEPGTLSLIGISGLCAVFFRRRLS